MCGYERQRCREGPSSSLFFSEPILWKKVIILLDEYDMPIQEAYVYGYWEQLVAFTRECLMQQEEVRFWYNGFTFGNMTEIYNPWSVLNYLDNRCLGPYWANTSTNGLVGKLIREGSRNIKQTLERMRGGEHLVTHIDEQIVFGQLDDNEDAIWSLLLASGYLKVVHHEEYDKRGEDLPFYELALTNHEVKIMFRSMIQGWFSRSGADYNDFVKTLLEGDLDAMNEYMNRVSCNMFSFF